MSLFEMRIKGDPKNITTCIHFLSAFYDPINLECVYYNRETGDYIPSEFCIGDINVGNYTYQQKYTTMSGVCDTSCAERLLLRGKDIVQERKRIPCIVSLPKATELLNLEIEFFEYGFKYDHMKYDSMDNPIIYNHYYISRGCLELERNVSSNIFVEFPTDLIWEFIV